MVRIIELSRSRLSAWLGPASKLNRDPAFIRELIDHGAVRADEFLAALSFERAWRAGDAEAVLAHFAEDAEIAAPGADGDVAAFVRGRLADGVAVDATRKQVARDGVTGRCASTAPGARPRRAARRTHHALQSTRAARR